MLVPRPRKTRLQRGSGRVPGVIVDFHSGHPASNDTDGLDCDQDFWQRETASITDEEASGCLKLSGITAPGSVTTQGLRLYRFVEQTIALCGPPSPRSAAAPTGALKAESGLRLELGYGQLPESSAYPVHGISGESGRTSFDPSSASMIMSMVRVYSNCDEYRTLQGNSGCSTRTGTRRGNGTPWETKARFRGSRSQRSDYCHFPWGSTSEALEEDAFASQTPD